MHRECLLGVALSRALADLDEERAAAQRPDGSRGQRLTDGQRTAIWSCFDKAMDEVLREGPSSDVIAVEAPSPAELVRLEAQRVAAQRAPNSPAPLSSDGDDQPSAKRKRRDDDQSERGNGDDESGSEDDVAVPHSALNFPMYRCVDGIWTIILKDPKVTLCATNGRGGGGRGQETLQLDYLKIVAKERTARPRGPSHRCDADDTVGRGAVWASATRLQCSWAHSRLRYSKQAGTLSTTRIP